MPRGLFAQGRKLVVGFCACVLEDVMKNRRPEPGTLGLLAAMGPGFCSELLLLQCEAVSC